MSKVKVIKSKDKGKEIELDNLYLDRHDLKSIAEKIERAFVYTNYVTDKNDVIAIKDSPGTPPQLKNKGDWRLFQELLAQADVLITASRYFRKVQEEDVESAQNVISQFDSGAQFEDLGEWRLENGFKRRNPDVAVVTRRLDFEIPENVINSDRKITVFTTHSMFESEEANNLRQKGVGIVASGIEGVEGDITINHLEHELGYKTIELVAGPQILKILLDANALDRLYISQVNREINVDEDKKITVLKGEKIENSDNFKLVEEYIQEEVDTEDGMKTSQKFLVYDNKRV